MLTTAFALPAHAGAPIAPLRVAVVEPQASSEPLQLPAGAAAYLVLRIALMPDGVEQLVASAVRVVVVDLRQTCTTQIRPILRLLRLLVPGVRVVAVTDAGDDAAATISIVSGAVSHLGRDQTPLELLQAVQSASRGMPCHGETGQRAVCRLQRDLQR